MTSQARNQSLDVLRFLAIFLVLGDHVHFYRLWFRAGWIGVNLFFVLSGFLISGLLFSELDRTGTIQIGTFLLRRGLKIWPGFYCLLLVATVFGVALGMPVTLRAALVNGSFLQNYVWAPRFVLMEHTWSLAVEEHFYLALPFLLLAIPRRFIPHAFAVLALLCEIIRILSPVPRIGMPIGPTHAYADSLFAGVLLQHLYRYHPEIFARLSRWPALFICAACCLPALFFDSTAHFIGVVEIPLLYIGFVFLLAWAIPRELPGTSSLAAIGKHSYSIYLWHGFFSVFFSIHIVTHAWEFWAYVLCAISVGVLMGEAIEFPVLRARDRWLPRTGRLLLRP